MKLMVARGLTRGLRTDVKQVARGWRWTR
ncbi:MAG: hypothetical protein QOH03_2503, partial [Kribbellaceae bacterium]|nr:hypothetical protein [Kribbellaceae bacterium]